VGVVCNRNDCYGGGRFIGSGDVIVECNLAFTFLNISCRGFIRNCSIFNMRPLHGSYIFESANTVLIENKKPDGSNHGGVLMKAIVYKKYGSPDVLQLKEVEKPEPKDDEVLIDVRAASINEWDWGLLRGKPLVNRFMCGLLRPKKINILGCDIAGRVDAVGKK